MPTTTLLLSAWAGANLPASLPSPSQGVWHLGPVPLRAYSLCILAGVFLAVWWGERRYQKAGGAKDTVVDTAIVAVPVGILGARAYHVVTSPGPYFGPEGSLANIPLIWHGGLGIWGGVAAGAAASAWMLRRRHLRAAPFADALAPGLLAAQAVGRFGNWFNQELFGGPTTLPWGLEIDADHLPDGYTPGTLFHPTFLYEALWNIMGAVVLLWLAGRLKAREGAVGGRLMWAYLMVYTAGRVWIEMLRVDEAQLIAGLRLNVWTSIIIFMVGLAGLIVTTRRGPSDAIVIPATSGSGTDGAVSGAEAPGDENKTENSATSLGLDAEGDSGACAP